MAAIPLPFLGTMPLLSPQETRDVIVALWESGLVRHYHVTDLLALSAQVANHGLGPGMGPALAARVYSDELAFIDGDARLTSAQLQRRCDATAEALTQVGFQAGDRIGLLARNGVDFYCLLVGASRAGIDVGYLNTGFVPAQIADVCESEGLAAVAVSDDLADRVPPEVTHLRLTDLTTGSMASDPGLRERLRALVPATSRSRHVILTSGTTGRPKGAARTGGGVDSIIALVSGLGLRARQKHLMAAPMFHAWGFSQTLITMLLSSTIVTAPRFDAEETLALIERERCEVVIAVPAMLQRIMNLPAETRARYDCSSLHTVAVSGSQLPAELALRFMAEYGDVLFNLFGSTEAAFATVASPADLRAAPGTAGRPLPGVSVRVVDADGRDCPAGTVGAILVGSGTSLESTVAIGDRGWFDAEGRLFIAGRDDDMVVTGGENVYPIVVEEVLRRHPAILDVAVVGAPDERFGEVLVAHVVPAADSDVELSELREWARGELAPFQLPSRLVRHDELPRNATGKVLARQLREISGEDEN